MTWSLENERLLKMFLALAINRFEIFTAFTEDNNDNQSKFTTSLFWKSAQLQWSNFFIANWLKIYSVRCQRKSRISEPNSSELLDSVFPAKDGV